MGQLRFSHLAEADLLSIGTYTMRTWGKARMARYLDELETCCRQLAGNPASRRFCDHVRPGLYRRVQGKHVIFFRREASGILLSGILHERMLPERHASTTKATHTDSAMIQTDVVNGIEASVLKQSC